MTGALAHTAWQGIHTGFLPRCPEAAGGAQFSFPLRWAMWLYRLLFARGGRLVYTGSLTPTSNPEEKERELIPSGKKE